MAWYTRALGISPRDVVGERGHIGPHTFSDRSRHPLLPHQLSCISTGRAALFERLRRRLPSPLLAPLRRLDLRRGEVALLALGQLGVVEVAPAFGSHELFRFFAAGAPSC